MEGQQVAVMARLDAYGATLLAEGFNSPHPVAFDLKYVVKLLAYDVKVTIDYDKYHEMESEYPRTLEKHKIQTALGSQMV